MATSPPQPYRGSHLTPRFGDATVADVMHAGVLGCGPDATLAEVARIMATHRVHCVVVNGIAADMDERLLWGIVSDADLMGAAAQAQNLIAGEIAATEVVTVEPATPLVEAARLMTERETSHLVVTSPRRSMPVGIISSLDIAAGLAWGADRA
jgi:CBS domain-containing protein